MARLIQVNRPRPPACSLGSCFLLAVALLVILASACDPRLLGRRCTDWPTGIYFVDDTTAYVSSIVAGGTVRLWTLDLTMYEVSDLREIRYVDVAAEDAQAYKTWKDANDEGAVRRTWSNKGFADGFLRNDFTAPNGATYSVVSHGEVLQIDMTKNGATRTVLRKEADRDVSEYSAEVTLVEPGKLYIAVGWDKYSSGRPEERRITAAGAVLYVAAAESGEITKELSLWGDAFLGTRGSVAQGPNGLVYVFSSSNYQIIVIDPQTDKIVTRFGVCK